MQILIAFLCYWSDSSQDKIELNLNIEFAFCSNLWSQNNIQQSMHLIEIMIQPCWLCTSKAISHRIHLSIHQAISHWQVSSQNEVYPVVRWLHCASHTSTERICHDSLYQEDSSSSCESMANNDHVLSIRHYVTETSSITLEFNLSQCLRK